MHLPSGYAAEIQQPWSPAMTVQSTQETSSWAWEDLEDTYIFPLSSPPATSAYAPRRGSIFKMSYRNPALSMEGSTTKPCAAAQGQAEESPCDSQTPSAASRPIPIRRRKWSSSHHGRRSGPRKSAQWRVTDAAEKVLELSWEQRQRFEQRFLSVETESESDSQDDTSEDACHCSECRSRKWKMQK
jgi:hypothetical protein